MGKYFKDAASLAAFISFFVAVVVIIAVIVGGFAFAVLGLFIVFFPIAVVVLAPLRRLALKHKGWFDRLVEKIEKKEDDVRNTFKTNVGASN